MKRQSKHTKQKEELATIVDNIEGFFDAEELYEKAKKKGISKATVYRYLQEAKKNQDLFAYTCNRRQIYSQGKKSHCHFICEKTGKIIHFDVDNIDFLKDKIPGTITSFQIEVKGICDTCKKKENDFH
ncbi:MAG: Fur family transcriptional regulator [Nanobdellota archaeon]